MSAIDLRFERFDLGEYETFLRGKGAPEFAILCGEYGCAEGLRIPRRYAHLVGAEVEPVEAVELSLPGFLFPDQRAIVGSAMEAERYACWSDCGLGKTPIEFEFARQVLAMVGGRVLIITVPEVVPQMVEEALKFYGRNGMDGTDGTDRFSRMIAEVKVLSTREEMRAWCGDESQSGVAVTNYEKMNPEGGPETQVVREMRALSGLILDESSRLKTGGGKQKWALIKSSKGIRFKLSCTATPAPNEVMEFASQASFLERIRDESEVIWTYFTRDPVTQEWTVKAHARPHFFRWMASWSIYLRDPEAYGWGRGIARVPEPVFLEHRVRATPDQLAVAREIEAAEAARGAAGNAEGDLWSKGDAKGLGMVGRNALSQVAKGFRYRKGETDGKRGVSRIRSGKGAVVAGIVAEDVRAGLQVLVWCIFDAEVDLVMEALERRGIRAESLGGVNSKQERAGTLERFRDGALPVLVGKAAMLGFGMNFQFCGSMVFSGFNDSFEAFYQAVRRAYRFGQTRRLRVHLPYVPKLEEPILRNVLRKARQFEELIAEQETAYIAARAELEGTLN